MVALNRKRGPGAWHHIVAGINKNSFAARVNKPENDDVSIVEPIELGAATA